MRNVKQSNFSLSFLENHETKSRFQPDAGNLHLQYVAKDNYTTILLFKINRKYAVTKNISLPDTRW